MWCGSERHQPSSPVHDRITYGYIPSSMCPKKWIIGGVRSLNYLSDAADRGESGPNIYRWCGGNEIKSLVVAGGIWENDPWLVGCFLLSSPRWMCDRLRGYSIAIAHVSSIVVVFDVYFIRLFEISRPSLWRLLNRLLLVVCRAWRMKLSETRAIDSRVISYGIQEQARALLRLSYHWAIVNPFKYHLCWFLMV